MTRDQLRWILLLVILLALIVFVVSLLDIVSAEEWMQGVLAVESILLILAVVLVYLVLTQTSSSKSLQKGSDTTLVVKHFQCPSCANIFVVKKSMDDTKQPFQLTCPDCGFIGKVSGVS
jgi:predicted RNA-binding Zn-ribbon protein involved in translation (DUF1610 family)